MKKTTSPASPAPTPLPSSGGCYVLEDGKLRPDVAQDEPGLNGALNAPEAPAKKD